MDVIDFPSMQDISNEYMDAENKKLLEIWIRNTRFSNENAISFVRMCCYIEVAIKC